LQRGLAWLVQRQHVWRALPAGLAVRHSLAHGTFWWLFISMHTYGGLAAPLAALAVLGLAAFLALYYAAGMRGLCGAGVAPGCVGRYYVCRPVDAGRAGARPVADRLSLGRWRLRPHRRPAGGYAPWLGVYGLGAVAAWLAGLLPRLGCSAAAGSASRCWPC
jgi:apolipoprotein N-acyltransferase